jgi:hypothetical protein
MKFTANPHMANEIKSTMATNIQRIQVSGCTLFEVFGGMPSGCFTTAPLNSLNNEYLLFSCFALLCIKHNIPWSFKIYNEHVERMFYGDDVVISVSDEFKDIFTREEVSKVMLEFFGMSLDSSAKDGSTATFDTYETASWISRFFRKLGKYPIYVGALKKISIHANFHYVSSISYEHLGTLMERAQWEAAFWEPEFYDKIQEAIRRCIEKEPKLLKFVQLQLQTSIHETAFDSAIGTAFPFNKDGTKRTPQTMAPSKLCTFYNQYHLLGKYFRKIASKIIKENITDKQLETIMGSYTQILHENFQKGVITKPEYKYIQSGPGESPIWHCHCTAALTTDDQKVETHAIGYTKAEAREGSAYDMCIAFALAEKLPSKKSQNKQLNFEAYKPEMNVSGGTVNKVPSAPMVQPDISVVSDSGLFTNTSCPTAPVTWNSMAMALDNPAGTGSPFDKKTACYSIYQRWESKNTTISPAMSSGSKVFVLSLDPKDLPEYIREYVDFHDNIIPAIDIVVAIAGAAGTIGWIVTGWVPDASKPNISLKDLQQISAETTNMNGTMVRSFPLHDIRRNGLYRKVKNDPEPYPGIVMMIDHAVTNVQRNDSVSYPVRVQVRLSQNCILMSPFSSSEAPPSNDSFNLGSYFYNEEIDALIGSSSTTNEPTETNIFPDHGFLTENFAPVFANNLVAHILNSTEGKLQRVTMVVSVDETIDPTYLAQVVNLKPTPGEYDVSLTMASKLIAAFGKVAPLEKQRWIGEEPTLYGTVYKLNIPIYMSTFRYNITSLVAQAEGCYLVAELDFSIVKANDRNFMVLNNCANRDFKQDYLYKFYRNSISYERTIAVCFQDTSHNNIATGDDFFQYIAEDGVDYTTKYTYVPDKPLQTFVCTGNNMPSAILPTGLKQLSFVRSGTTTTVAEDLPFTPLYKPIIRNAFKALDEILADKAITMAKMNLIINGENKGEIGYNSSTFFVRTDTFKVSFPRVGNSIKLSNITELSSPQGLTVFNTTSMSPWVTPGTRRYRPRINFNDYVPEASAIAGGMISGLGSGLSAWANQQFQSRMLQQLHNNNSALQGANNAALAKRQKEAFERNLELKGYGSSLV